MVVVLSQYAKVAGSKPGQGTYKNQPMSTWIGEMTDGCFSLPLSPSTFLSHFKINKYKNLKAHLTLRPLLWKTTVCHVRVSAYSFTTLLSSPNRTLVLWTLESYCNGERF